jgi:hypothetical protein
MKPPRPLKNGIGMNLKTPRRGPNPISHVPPQVLKGRRREEKKMLGGFIVLGYIESNGCTLQTGDFLHAYATSCLIRPSWDRLVSLHVTFLICHSFFSYLFCGILHLF